MPRILTRAGWRAAVAAVLMLASPGFDGASAASLPPRNILLIIADDLGTDSLGLYNTHASASLPPTPNLAALAARGVLFRNAYAQAVCSPSRCAMLTGRYGFRTGVLQPAGGAAPGVQTNELTLPEVFAANPQLGYATASIGKWHLAGGMTGPNVQGGWPHFSGALSGALADYTSWTKVVNGVATMNHPTYATTDNVNDSLAWIAQRGTNRWFLWLAFNAGHTPFHKPPNDLHGYDALSGAQPDINANPRPYYEAAIEAVDTEIGRLLSQIDTTNTTVLFLGDNGTPGRVIQPPFNSQRGKDTLYEGGVRVPFIVADPDIAAPNRVSDALVHCVDVYATVLELAGASLTAALPAGFPSDSRSLVPILLNEPFTTVEDAVLMENTSTMAAAQSGRAVRRGDFKLIQPTGGSEEFYDLAADPLENMNLLAGALTAAQEIALDGLRAKLAACKNVPEARHPRIGALFIAEAAWFSGANLSLWRSTNLASPGWTQVPNATVDDLGTTLRISDPQPPAGAAFYRLRQD